MAEPYALHDPPLYLVLAVWNSLTRYVYRVPGISATPHDDNLRYFDVRIHGPVQSPYEGNSCFKKVVARV